MRDRVSKAPTISTEKPAQKLILLRVLSEWSGPGSNRRHMDFQSIALPTELPDLAKIKI